MSSVVAMSESEIIELEYIQSSGTQYIGTDFVPNQNSRMRIKYQTSQTSSGGVAVACKKWKSKAFGLWVNAAGFGANVYSNAVLYGEDPIEVDFNKNQLLKNGELIWTSATATFECPVDLTLFALNSSSGASEYVSAILYFCQIYDNGLLVRDYIPAKTIDGEIGLYDRVFKEFYRNAGTGAFVAGPEMVHDGYTELEYIEADGNQYVDSLVASNQDTRVVMDFTSNGVDSGFQALFGARNGSSSAAFCMGLEPDLIYPQYGNVAYNYTQMALDYVQRMQYDMNKNVAKVGNKSVNFPSATFSTSHTLCLLSLNSAGTVDNRMAKGLIYSCQIYDNGTEVRIYIPMRHPSGVAGLWDSVNERFYASATTTDFIAGPEAIKAPKAPANFRVVSESDTKVSLAWDAAENAVSYLVRQSGEVIADTTELTATAKIQPFGYYTFEVSAYNEYGEGERSTLAVFRTPDNPMLWLVTDRTVQDVTAKNNKGSYNTADLNRVGAAVELLKGLLESAGFVVNVAPTLMWKDTEWMNFSQAEQYLADIQELRSKQAVLSATPKTPTTMDQLNYTRANNIEQILLDVYTQYLIMLTTRVAAGTATSGGDYL